MNKYLRKGAVVRSVWLFVILLLLASGSEVGQAGYGYSCGGWIGDGDIIYDSVPTSGYPCRYWFDGQRNDHVTIRMTKRSYRLDPYLKLYDPYDYLVDYDDDDASNSNSIISYTLRRTGTYEISAGSYNNYSSGPFTLRLDID